MHRLAAGMSGIGYLFAFVFPLLGGVAWQVTGDPGAASSPRWWVPACRDRDVLAGASIGVPLAIKFQ